jgi:hypothetical protein
MVMIFKTSKEIAEFIEFCENDMKLILTTKQIMILLSEVSLDRQMGFSTLVKAIGVFLVYKKGETVIFVTNSQQTSTHFKCSIESLFGSIIYYKGLDKEDIDKIREIRKSIKYVTLNNIYSGLRGQDPDYIIEDDYTRTLFDIGKKVVLEDFIWENDHDLGVTPYLEAARIRKEYMEAVARYDDLISCRRNHFNKRVGNKDVKY